MGADLYLKCNNENIWLGRASYYYENTIDEIHDGDGIDRRRQDKIHEFASIIKMLCSYRPKTLDELYQLNDQIDDAIEQFTESVSLIESQQILNTIVTEAENPIELLIE